MPGYRFLLLLLCFALPTVASAQREKIPPRDLKTVKEKWPNATREPIGLYTELLREGTGPKAQRGHHVEVYYEGFLIDGTKFDEAQPDKGTFKFQLDRGMVIKGWEFGILMMHVGERRRIIVPYELAYGTAGRAPDIPRMATLIFDVELVSVSDTRPETP